jgi:hypothetical protein
MTEHIHPLVMATIEEHRARKELELERLRSAREACTTASPGGQSRAMALGKKIREVESVVAGWRLAVATLLAEELTATAPLPVEEELNARQIRARSEVDYAKDLVDAVNGNITGPDRVVGSRSRTERILRCIRCTHNLYLRFGNSNRLQLVVSTDLPDGGVCNDCACDVLA